MPGTPRRQTAALYIPIAIADNAISAWLSSSPRGAPVAKQPMAKPPRMALSRASARVTAGDQGPPRDRSAIRAPIASPTPNPTRATSERRAAATSPWARCRSSQRGVARHVRGEDVAEREKADGIGAARPCSQDEEHEVASR